MWEKYNIPVENTNNVLFQIPFCLKTSVRFPIASSMAETIPCDETMKSIWYLHDNSSKIDIHVYAFYEIKDLLSYILCISTNIAMWKKWELFLPAYILLFLSFICIYGCKYFSGTCNGAWTDWNGRYKNRGCNQ